MKKIVLKISLTIVVTIVVLISIISCRNEPVSKSFEGKNIEVEFMFEKDGVKVYRFYDGRYHYFTTNGETISNKKNGKSDYDENIK